MRAKLWNAMAAAALLGGVAACGGGVKARVDAATTANGGPNPSGDLDQCANGTISAPVSCTTAGPGGAWQNGNLNQNQAHYFEGQSVPYRLVMGNVPTTGTNTVTISWDTTKGGAHGLDYVTTYNRTETTANPCAGVAGCSTFSTWPIPIDANVANGPDGVSGTADDIVQVPGVFTLFGGTITGVSAYTLTGSYGGDSNTRITISFTASTATPVLAWGGHISLHADWAPQDTAAQIPGSSYHTSFVDLDGKGGNQDRSLSAAAVHLPPTLLVVKHVINDNGGTAVASDFTITVTGNVPAPSSFPGNEVGTLVTFAGAGPYAVGESGPSGYAASFSTDCAGTLAIDETRTCTVTNDDVNRCLGVVCPPADQCNQIGVCDPATGQCTAQVPVPDGTPCDDGNACTADTCQAGACTGVPDGPVCPPADQCHEVGACDPASGQCTPQVPKPDGTPCDDGNACTVDTCQAGVCTGVVIDQQLPTRTGGFFMNHEAALAACLEASPVDLGVLHLATVPEALGLLWADPLKFVGGDARHAYDRAALHVLRQALVATCNQRLFGANTQAMVDAAVARLQGPLCTPTLDQLELDLVLANDAGIEVALPPGFNPGPLTPAHAQSIAQDTTAPLSIPPACF